MANMIETLIQRLIGMQRLKMPLPVALKGHTSPAAGTQINSSSIIPDPRNTGIWYQLLAAADGSIARYDATGALTYTLAPADLNVSCAAITGHWIDTTEGRIYFWGEPSPSTGSVYMGYTTIDAKAVTALGLIATGFSVAGGTTPSGLVVHRAGLGVGDFSLYRAKVAGTLLQKAVVTTAGGLTSAAASVTFGGLSTGMYFPVMAFGGMGFYVAKDESFLMAFYTVSSDMGVVIFRGGAQGSIDAKDLGIIIHNGTTNLGAVVTEPYIQLVGQAASVGVTMCGPRVFNRQEFDTLIHAAADRLNLPR